MMDCKKALEEARGDAARALEILRERGIAKAGKRVGRAGSEGRVIAAVSPDERTGALVELNCETDFVAKTDDFNHLGDALARAAFQHSPRSADELLDLSLNGEKLRDKLTAAVAKLGEDLAVRRIDRLEAPASGRVASYIHAGGKIGTLVAIESANLTKPEVKALAHNVCMHVAATSPASLSRDDLPKALVDEERRILTVQAATEGKPPAIIEKMIEGRLQKFFKEVVLLEQGLVMDPDKTVGKAAQEAGAKVVGFRRFQLGEAAAE
jgi:elongation factor Ts